MKASMLLMFVIIWGVGASADDLGCEGGSHRDEMECQDKRLKSLDAELNRAYKLAIASLPKQDSQDNRKGREQLRKSQRAWLVYIREQCDLEGGQRGGSNSWVSTFAGECQEREYKVRIGFLQSIADQTFGTN
jgi:uncharacterized protein YecT (DUF1311 family)